MAKCYHCFKDGMKVLTKAKVGDSLLAPVCKCGEHYVLQSVDMENLTATVACPKGCEGHQMELHLTGEWNSRPDLYVLVHAQRYGRIPCILKGHVRDVAFQLAKFARSKCKGRMTESSVRCYADVFETALRRDAEKEETSELQWWRILTFEVG